MANKQTSDEQVLYNAFQGLADVLLPLKQELRVRAHAMVGAFLGLATPGTGAAEAPPAGTAKAPPARPAGRRSPPPTKIASGPSPTKIGSAEPPSPKDFLSQKRPGADVERVACLAYYLTHHRATPHFKTPDISKLNAEAGKRKFAKPASTVGNATRLGYLALATKGMKRITAEGERYVDALPDRAAAQAASGKRKVRRPRRRGQE